MREGGEETRDAICVHEKRLNVLWWGRRRGSWVLWRSSSIKAWGEGDNAENTHQFNSTGWCSATLPMPARRLSYRPLPRQLRRGGGRELYELLGMPFTRLRSHGRGAFQVLKFSEKKKRNSSWMFCRKFNTIKEWSSPPPVNLLFTLTRKRKKENSLNDGRFLTPFLQREVVVPLSSL